MENFKLACKKCKSDNVIFRLSVEGYDEERSYYSLLELKCKDCKITETVEETIDLEIDKEFNK